MVQFEKSLRDLRTGFTSGPFLFSGVHFGFRQRIRDKSWLSGTLERKSMEALTVVYESSSIRRNAGISFKIDHDAADFARFIEDAQQKRITKIIECAFLMTNSRI
jgi:hypothetical protein